VLEVFYSDELRLAIAERVARKSELPPAETVPDLVAGALAARDFTGAIRILESERDRKLSSANNLLLLTYLYCLNGSLEKAQALAIASASSIKKDGSVDWLWRKLATDFGFHPPR